MKENRFYIRADEDEDLLPPLDREILQEEQTDDGVKVVLKPLPVRLPLNYEDEKLETLLKNGVSPKNLNLGGDDKFVTTQFADEINDGLTKTLER